MSSHHAEKTEYELHSLSLAFQTYLRHDKSERSHWEDVCNAYRQYAMFALCQWANQRHRIAALPESQRNLLPKGLKDTIEGETRFTNFKDSAIRNQFCLDCILRHAGMPHSQQIEEATTAIVADDQISKVSSVLKSLARDWSLEGKLERDLAYVPLMKQVKAYVPLLKSCDDLPKICVPGAGVGRLAFELFSMGYTVQGNEFSLFMLLASDFVLNSEICNPSRPMVISPWLLESRNVHSCRDPVRKVHFPDVDPTAILRTSPDETQPDFSMAAGEFSSIYGHPREASQWDAVVCCFFLDATPNIVECIQIIHQMLKDNGVLINFGPLLYHWSGPAMRPDDRTNADYQSRFSNLDKRYLASIDLSWEDVREILMNVGFELVVEEVGIPSLYTADRKSMLNMAYRCIHFVARKRTKIQCDEKVTSLGAG